jgi:hypothetical protein
MNISSTAIEMNRKNYLVRLLICILGVSWFPLLNYFFNHGYDSFVNNDILVAAGFLSEIIFFFALFYFLIKRIKFIQLTKGEIFGSFFLIFILVTVTANQYLTSSALQDNDFKFMILITGGAALIFYLMFAAVLALAITPFIFMLYVLFVSKKDSVETGYWNK